MRYSLIIWDFNGTIIDDLELSYRSINTVLQRRNLPLIADKSAYRKYFDFPIKDYYSALGMDFTKEPYKVPADEWVYLYNEGKKHLELIPGVKNIIRKISFCGVPQIVLSASEKDLLTEQLTKLSIIKYFKFVLGCDDVYAVGKIEMAKKWASQADIDLSLAVLIGDTDHDFQVAKALGCDCILYSGGHMDRERLLKTEATVIDSMDKLFQLL